MENSLFFPSPILGRVGKSSDRRHQVNLYDNGSPAAEDRQRQELGGVHTRLHWRSERSALVPLLLFAERARCRWPARCQAALRVCIGLFCSWKLICSFPPLPLLPRCGWGGWGKCRDSLFRPGVGSLQPSCQVWPFLQIKLCWRPVLLHSWELWGCCRRHGRLGRGLVFHGAGRICPLAFYRERLLTLVWSISHIRQLKEL